MAVRGLCSGPNRAVGPSLPCGAARGASKRSRRCVPDPGSSPPGGGNSPTCCVCPCSALGYPSPGRHWLQPRDDPPDLLHQRVPRMALAEPQVEVLRALEPPPGEVYQREAHCFDPLGPPPPAPPAPPQPLHRLVEVNRQPRGPPPGGVLPEVSRGELAPGEVLLQHPLGLFALAAALVVPGNQLLRRHLPVVAADRVQLIGLACHYQCRERENRLLRFHAWQCRLRQHFPQSEVAILRVAQAVGNGVGHVGHLQVFLTRLHPLPLRVAVPQPLPPPLPLNHSAGAPPPPRGAGASALPSAPAAPRTPPAHSRRETRCRRSAPARTSRRSAAGVTWTSCSSPERPP